MGSSRIGSNPTCSVLASYCLSFYADGFKSKLQMTGVLAKITQLGERQTEDLQVSGSVPGFGIMDNWHLQ